MKHTPQIAVLMATYNGQQWIKPQLDSVFAQTGCILDVYVNDDSSSDKTLEIIACHPLVSKINVSQHPCGSAGQNFLFLISQNDLSAYDFVAFCDQDDVWEPDKLARAAAKLEEREADGYSSDVTAFWPDGDRRLIAKSQHQRNFDHHFESAGPGCTFVLPCDTVADFRNFLADCSKDQLSKVTLHDWFIYCWARGTGRNWIIDNFSGLDYRQHDNNVLGAARGRAAWKKRWEMVFDGWYLSQARLNAELTGARNRPVRFLEERRLGDLIYCLRHYKQLRRRKSEAAFLMLIFVLYFLRLA